MQLASHAGATVIATASGDDEAYVKSIGASRVSVIFNHGLRHELLDRNLVQWVRQNAKRKKIPAVLEVEGLNRYSVPSIFGNEGWSFLTSLQD